MYASTLLHEHMHTHRHTCTPIHKTMQTHKNSPIYAHRQTFMQAHNLTHTWWHTLYHQVASLSSHEDRIYLSIRQSKLLPYGTSHREVGAVCVLGGWQVTIHLIQWGTGITVTFSWTCGEMHLFTPPPRQQYLFTLKEVEICLFSSFQVFDKAAWVHLCSESSKWASLRTPAEQKKPNFSYWRLGHLPPIATPWAASPPASLTSEKTRRPHRVPSSQVPLTVTHQTLNHVLGCQSSNPLWAPQLLCSGSS